jgi:phosphotransacetylase
MQKNIFKSLFTSLIVLLIILLASNKIFAHCDTMDGPVVKAAQKALETGHINLVLLWVQPADEATIKEAFNKTLKIRKLNADARDLADMYFFETFVRIHRAGEGVPYTGIKPAGTEIEPGIKAADEAIEKGSAEKVVKELNEQINKSLHELFMEVKEKKQYDSNNVKDGREYVKAYVQFMHFVEKLFEASKKPVECHGHE